MQSMRVRNQRVVSVVAVAAAIFMSLEYGAAHVGAGDLVASAQAQALAQALPHRDGPQLLSRQEVQAGLQARLQQMRGRRSARQARRIEEQRQRVAAHLGAATETDVPREPDPPTPPQSLEP